MSEAQRCASVMRRYGLEYAPNSVERGCFESTCRELERQDSRIAELEQQLEDTRKGAERYRAHIQEAANRSDQRVKNFESLLSFGDKASKTHPHVLERDWHLSAIAASKPAGGE